MDLGDELPDGAVINTTVFAAARRRKRGPIDASVDLARRELWRAYQRGSLTEDELARSLDRLEFGAMH